MELFRLNDFGEGVLSFRPSSSDSFGANLLGDFPSVLFFDDFLLNFGELLRNFMNFELLVEDFRLCEGDDWLELAIDDCDW